MLLKNLKSQSTIAHHVLVASSFTERLTGLLGKTEFPKGHALWIERTNSIHTFFMKFSIDVIFVDKNLIVKSVHQNLKPWRMTVPVLGADSVFELTAGELKNLEIKKGDQLYVGT
jgi:uncharacterized membrane protein (UPF0127 family)